MKHKCKITVLRREFYQDLADKYQVDPKVGKCNIFQDGQEFIQDGRIQYWIYRYRQLPVSF